MLLSRKKIKKRTEPPLKTFSEDVKGVKDISDMGKKQYSNVDIENSKSENMKIDNQLPKLTLETIIYSCINKDIFNKIKTCDVTNIYSATNDNNTTEDEKMGTLLEMLETFSFKLTA